MDTSSTVSRWLTASPAPPPPRCPPGEEPQPTPACLGDTPPRHLRPRLPTCSLLPLLSSHTMGLLSTTITTTPTISISPHPTPHLLPRSHRCQRCFRPPCTQITPLQNNTHCEPGMKGKRGKKRKTKERFKSFEVLGEL